MSVNTHETHKSIEHQWNLSFNFRFSFFIFQKKIYIYIYIHNIQTLNVLQKS